METRALDDELLMSLVEMALSRPHNDRRAYLEGVCAGNPDLFSSVWNYVQWEQRMGGFLLEPLCPPASLEHPFQQNDVLIERFRIEREIAQGGMGVVYVAWDQKLERRIAIKCAKTGFRMRLPPEVRHAREISHPNVCKIFEIHTAGTDQGDIDFISMEFLEGETLTERLRRGPLSKANARVIAQQLCAGLAEAHRNHVIHGDLKSNNVILSTGADGALRAVITDFGLARSPGTAQRNTNSGAVGGTPDYMAPEFWKGEKASIESDIYALGVILYEVVSGRRPYPSDLAWEERLTRKPPAVDPKWDRILARCLAPDPGSRFHGVDQIIQMLAPTPTRRWLLAAAAAVVLPAVFAGGAISYIDHLPVNAIPSVAVIRFVNAQRTPETEYLSDGLSEGLINALVQLPDLKVIARSSSFKFDGNLIDVRKVARTLGVKAVITGRVSEIGGRLRIIAELVDGADGTQIWSAEYGSGITELADVQAVISRAIALHIRSKLTPAERARLVKQTKANPDAYALLLRARYHMRLYTPQSKQQAVSYYQQALAIDPGFALANAELASAYRLLSGSAILSSEEMMPLALAAAKKALAADPDLAEAHLALAVIKKDQWDWEGAEPEFRRAIELSPNEALVHHAFANFLSVTGRYEEAVKEIKRARDLDPISLPMAIDSAAVYYNGRRYDFALEELNRAANLDPAAPAPWTWMGIVNGGSGQFAAAMVAYQKAIALGDNSAATKCYYAYSLGRSGKRNEALQILNGLQRSGEFVPPSALALGYLSLNHKDRAIKLLQDAYNAQDPMVQYLAVESHFDTLKDDRHFQNLVAKIGRPRLRVVF